MVDIAAEAREIIRKSSEIENNGCYGFSWGLPFLDSVTGGIEIGKTYVAGATKKSGKTKFVINTIHALHEQGVPSFFMSLEMNGEGVTKELLTRFTSIGNDAFKSKLCAADEQAFNESVNNITQYLSVDRESGLTLMQVRHKMDMAARRGCKVVFMDYLQRMEFKYSKNSGITYATTIGNVVIGLADAAKELGVALIFLSQLSNVAENQNAGIEHLKESGGIAEGVDCIFILNNQDRINKNYTNKTNEVWIAIEQRSGRSGMLKCRVDLSTDTYWEVESVRKPEF
jgi:replicative DNA helicase